MENEKKGNKNTKINNKTTQKKGNGKKNSPVKKSNNSNSTKGVTKNKNNNKIKKDNIKEVKKEKEKVVKLEEKNEEIVVEENKKIETKEEIVNEVSSDNCEEKTNKKGLIVLLVMLLAIVGVCIFYQVDEKETKSSVSSKESNEIMDDFYKYFNSKKAKIIYYASSQCGYCELETPIMEQIDKDYDIDYLYIDSSKLTKADREKILKELDIKHATPTTVVVKNGKALGTQVGYVDGGKMIEFLKENKILEESAVYTPEQYINFINYEEFTNILKQDGKSVVTIGQTGCSHCIATKPVLNRIAKEYNIKVNYLNLTEMTESENTSLVNSLSEIGYDEEEFVSNGNFGTPLTLIIENGKVISYVSGERPTVQFVKAFKKVGVISE